MRWVWVALVLAGGVVGCTASQSSHSGQATALEQQAVSGSGKPSNGDKMVELKTPAELSKNQGKRVVISGTAANAKVGPAVLFNGHPLYLMVPSPWPSEMHGKPVRLSGIVQSKKVAPDPVDDDGQIMQGMWGNAWVLEHVTVLPSELFQHNLTFGKRIVQQVIQTHRQRMGKVFRVEQSSLTNFKRVVRSANGFRNFSQHGNRHRMES
jgi:hypothetical protein